MVRHLLTCLGGSSSTLGWEANKNGGSFSAVTTSSSNIKFVDSANVTGDYQTTEQLGGAGTFNNTQNTGSEDGAYTCPGLTAGGQIECEAVLSIVDADTSPGDTIVFRPGPTNINAHNVTLTITVGPLGSGGPPSGLVLLGCGD